MPSLQASDEWTVKQVAAHFAVGSEVVYYHPQDRASPLLFGSEFLFQLLQPLWRMGLIAARLSPSTPAPPPFWNCPPVRFPDIDPQQLSSTYIQELRHVLAQN